MHESLQVSRQESLQESLQEPRQESCRNPCRNPNSNDAGILAEILAEILTEMHTGSNTGIGKETALDLLQSGALVVFAARDEGRTMQVINSIQDMNQRQNAFFLKLDLYSYDSISEFVECFKNKFGTLDVLVNNAGGIFDTFTLKEGVETTTMTNHVGQVFLTALLIPHLRPEAMIVNVISDSLLD